MEKQPAPIKYLTNMEDKKICLIWRGYITEIFDNGGFSAEVYNVIENTTKESVTFPASKIKGELKVGKVFYWVMTRHDQYLQFMRNVSHEEEADALKKAIAQAKEWNRSLP